MKKLLFVFTFLALGTLPLACGNRNLSNPVTPDLQPTATPTSSIPVSIYLICTITPTPTIYNVDITSPGSNSSFVTAQALGAVNLQDVDVNGNLGGTAASPENDYYSFVVNSGGTWKIWLDCYYTPPSPSIYLYDSNYNVIGSATATYPTATFPQNDYVSISLDYGKTYYLRVVGYGTTYVAKIMHP